MTMEPEGGRGVEAPGRVFVDTGAWYDYLTMEDDAEALSPDDERLARILEAEAIELVASTYVFDEVVTLVQARLGSEAAVQAGNLLRDPSIVRLEPVMAEDEEAAWRLFQDRPDKTYSFTDCTSFVLMARMGIEAAATTDSDFEREGFANLAA